MRNRYQLLLISLALFVLACSEAPIPSGIYFAGDLRANTKLSSSSPYGINAGRLMNDNPIASARLDTVTKFIRDAGIAWVRLDFEWAYIQNMAKNGVPDPCNTGGASRNQSTWHWEWQDVSVQRATTAGINVLGVLGLFTPSDESQVCGDNGAFYNPKDWLAWEAFVAAAVARFPQIKAWEIWNEPNAGAKYYLGCAYPHCASGTSVARAYADLVIHAAPIIRAAGGIVVAPGAADAAGATASFVGEVMQYAASSIDVVSFHSYGTSIPSLTSSIAASADPFGVRNFWVTEAGYPNAKPTQAQIQSDLTTRWNTRPARVQKIFYWHAYSDYNSFGEAGPEVENRHIIGGYGTGGIARLPSWYTYQNIIQPPPSSYWANIVGPNSMRPGNYCNWYVQSSVPDPTYEWRVNGTTIGTGAEVFYSAGGDFTIEVSVYGGTGGAGASMNVDVSNSNEDCYIQ